MKKIIVAATLLLISTLSVTAQTADEVINKYIDAIGGKAKWLSINSLKIEGQFEVQGVTIPLTMQAINNKASRMDAEFQGMKLIEIITTSAGWSMNGMNGQTSLQPMSSEELKNRLDQLDIQDQLIDYAQKGHKIEMLGKDEVDGTDYFKIKLNTKNEGERIYFIDTKTYLIYKTESISKVNGQDVKTESKYLDYQTLENGTKMAFKSEVGQMMMVVKKVTINPVIDESIFKGN